MDTFDLIQAILGASMDVDTAELDKLEKMLVKADIPYRRLPMQIAYYGPSGEQPGEPEPGVIRGAGVGAICSVIAHGYGSEEGLLEISGLLTPEEAKYNSVLGYLDAENVFARIEKHYKENV